MIYCLFEQSGEFKNMFISHGFEAKDFDCENLYNQTDIIIDLFTEIENAYINKKSIFDKMNKSDFLMIFFPCTHFCDANSLQYRLLIGGRKRELNKESCDRLIVRNKDRAKYFELYLKLTCILKERGLRAIIENPASGGGNNYLALYSPIDISYHEKDRSLFGDYFKKPTNYFAINFEMKEQFSMFSKNYDTKTIYGDTSGMIKRSLLAKEYVENFYKRFLEGKINA